MQQQCADLEMHLQYSLARAVMDAQSVAQLVSPSAEAVLDASSTEAFASWILSEHERSTSPLPMPRPRSAPIISRLVRDDVNAHKTTRRHRIRSASQNRSHLMVQDSLANLARAYLSQHPYSAGEVERLLVSSDWELLLQEAAGIFISRRARALQALQIALGTQMHQPSGAEQCAKLMMSSPYHHARYVPRAPMLHRPVWDSWHQPPRRDDKALARLQGKPLACGVAGASDVEHEDSSHTSSSPTGSAQHCANISTCSLELSAQLGKASWASGVSTAFAVGRTGAASVTCQRSAGTILGSSALAAQAEHEQLPQCGMGSNLEMKPAVDGGQPKMRHQHSAPTTKPERLSVEQVPVYRQSRSMILSQAKMSMSVQRLSQPRKPTQALPLEQHPGQGLGTPSFKGSKKKPSGLLTGATAVVSGFARSATANSGGISSSHLSPAGSMCKFDMADGNGTASQPGGSVITLSNSMTALSTAVNEAAGANVPITTHNAESSDSNGNISSSQSTPRVESLLGLTRMQARMRGWHVRRRQEKISSLEAREAAAMQSLTSWARRRHLRNLFWETWQRKVAAAVEATMAGIYDPTQPEFEVDGTAVQDTDDPIISTEALATLGQPLGQDSEHSYAIADALDEYCELTGIDARIKRGGTRFRDAMSSDHESINPPAMSRMYKEMQGRSMRIFFSSTARDMQKERDTFFKQYAPELESLGKERGAFISFVDLHRGEDVKVASAGDVVNISLTQITESRYFVGFLGLRYGWRPSVEALTAQTIENFGSCIRSYIPGRSVMEFEMLFGALGWGPDAACAPTSAFFYFRADAFCDKMPIATKDTYVDKDVKVQKKLKDLKQRIQARAAESDKYHGKAVSGAKLPFVESCRSYGQPVDFARLLYDDLCVAIKRDHPGRKLCCALDEQFVRHLQFASQHCHVYVGHDHVQLQINDYVASATTTIEPRRPLILVGGSGSGKSAALANWLFRASAVKGFVFPHFCNSAESSNRHEGFLQRLAAELKRSFGFEHELPEDKGELMEIVPKWISLACAKTTVVIIIDGIDQLVEMEAGKLAWMPSVLPRNCSVLLSTSKESPVYESIVTRGWSQIVNMPKLATDSREQLAVEVMQRHGKALESFLFIILKRAKQTAMPLYLHMVLSEVAANAVFDTAHPLIVTCLEQQNTDDLARLTLERLETQFGEQLISSALSFLVASRFGMSESELLEALQISQVDWCILLAAVRPMLCESAGLLIVSNQVMHRAIRLRYLTSDLSIAATHRKLASFFDSVMSQTTSNAVRIRCCAELPFQMIYANEIDELNEFLLDITRVRHLLKDPSLSRDLASLWAEANHGKVPSNLASRYIESLERYEPTLKNQVTSSFEMQGRDYDETQDAHLELLSDITSQVGCFLSELYQYEGAVALHKRALEINRKRCNDMSERVAQNIRMLANTLTAMGGYEEAVENFYMALGIYALRTKADPWARIEYAQTLFEMAGVARYLEDASRARQQCLSALKTFRQVHTA